MIKKLFEEYWMNLIHAEKLIESLEWCEKFRGNLEIEEFRDSQLKLYENEKSKCKAVKILLDQLEDPAEKEIISLKYFDRMKNSKIADITGYSTSHIPKKVKVIINKLEKMQIINAGG